VGCGGRHRSPDRDHRHACCSYCGEPAAQGEAGRCQPTLRWPALAEHHGESESITVAWASEQPGAWWPDAAGREEPVAGAVDRTGTITVGQALAVSEALAIAEPEFFLAVA